MMRRPSDRLLHGIVGAGALISGALLAGLVPGCGSPLVGLSCKSGFSECGNSCVDLTSSAAHCGACGTSCERGEVCQDSACIPASEADAGKGDGGRPDAGLDGGPDDDGGGQDDGSVGDDAGENLFPDAGTFPDVSLPPVCSGPGSPVDCVCELGQLKCDDTCVEAANDELHCGSCGTICQPLEVCAAGQCVDDCPAVGLSSCGGECVDTSNDPDHCGSCTNACATGLCANGECLGSTVGHVIVVGHDLSSSRGALRRLAGNAVFLPGGDPLRVLVYREFSTPAVGGGVNTVISSMATLEGRTPQTTEAESALTVPFLLSQADVFVVAAQALATDDALVKAGESWGRAMREFVRLGGVIVLFDGGGDNLGTYQILDTAGLFEARSRTALDARPLTLVAPGDAVASFVQTTYASEGATVGFDSDESTVVVRDPMSLLPVVIHIAR
jgi:hypothetical protein